MLRTDPIGGRSNPGKRKVCRNMHVTGSRGYLYNSVDNTTIEATEAQWQYVVIVTTFSYIVLTT